MKTWSDEEVRILIENYNRVSNRELAVLLPNKSARAIYKKAYKMGLKKTKEIEFVNRSEAKRTGCKKVRRRTSKGYIQILRPDHPRADRAGYVMEHIVVWEEKTGVLVPRNCCIHHLNGDKSDNRISNLCLMESGAHTSFHHTGHSLSEETRSLISRRAIERLSDKKSHPFYKQIDPNELLQKRSMGHKVSDICAQYGISKRTYYDKIKEAETHNAQ